MWPGKGGACRKVGATANLDSSSARRREQSAGRDEETGSLIEQRNRQRKTDKLLVDKTPYKETALGGTSAGAARSAYGDLRGARDLNGGRFSTRFGLEYEHNLDVTAWILLNGDLSFRPTCDFKELGVAEMSRAIPFKL